MPVQRDQIIHPDDKAALDNLISIPLFTECAQAFLKFFPERVMYGMSMAQKIKLGPDQLPDLYNILPPIVRKLGIDTPDLFLEMDPSPNAYTFGDSRIVITITSGLVEYLEPDELAAVIAHECGHILCRHVLYHTMATVLTEVGASVFGPLAAVSLPVQLALLAWSRRSELSADRAGAIAVGSIDPMIRTMVRLAGGPRAITEKVNLEVYVQQAADFDEMMESHWNRLAVGVKTLQQDHPPLSVRTRELLQWGKTESFQRLLRAVSAPVGSTCAVCQQEVNPDWKFCKSCGSPLK